MFSHKVHLGRLLKERHSNRIQQNAWHDHLFKTYLLILAEHERNKMLFISAAHVLEKCQINKKYNMHVNHITMVYATFCNVRNPSDILITDRILQ